MPIDYGLAVSKCIGFEKTNHGCMYCTTVLFLHAQKKYKDTSLG